MMWQRYLMVAVGGAVGAVLRYAVSGWVSQRLGVSFPWGTAVVNLTGSFLLGVLGVLVTERLALPGPALTLLGVGVLGGYTTFSTWQYETLRMLENGSWAQGLANLAGAAIGGLASMALGVAVGRLL
ncbi:MAG TPA: fluoride efflux transporter CrcB [Limnochordales bacterium]